MPKAMRTCVCGKVIHVRKNPCDCGHVFPKKNAPVAPSTPRVQVTQTAPVEAPYSPPANEAPSGRLLADFQNLQNYVRDLEKQMDAKDKKWEAKLAHVELQYKKFYTHQAYLIYQRAFEYFGGKGDLYYSKEHGDNPKLFKAQSDETGVFIPPSIMDRTSEYPEGPATDEMIEKTAEAMVEYRTPIERDLNGDGIMLDDVMSFSYAGPVVIESPTPTVENAVEHVKFLIGDTGGEA